MSETTKVLELDEWYDKNEQDLTCLFAETGADRELDFDMEQLQEKLYEEYLNDSKQS